jgi:hypothetical protein
VEETEFTAVEEEEDNSLNEQHLTQVELDLINLEAEVDKLFLVK